MAKNKGQNLAQKYVVRSVYCALSTEVVNYLQPATSQLSSNCSCYNVTEKRMTGAWVEFFPLSTCSRTS